MNPKIMKRINRIAVAHMGTRAICWSSRRDNERGLYMTSRPGCRPVQATETDFSCVEYVSHLWHLTLIVQRDHHTLETLEVAAPYPCRHHQLVESLTDTHSKLLAGDQEVELMAWVATTKPISDKEALRHVGVDPEGWTLADETDFTLAHA